MRKGGYRNLASDRSSAPHRSSLDFLSLAENVIQFGFAGGNSAESSLKPHVVQPQRVRDRIYAVLSGQLDRSLPQWLWQLRPLRLGAAKLIQLALQLYDRLRDRWCAFPVHDQVPLAPD